jgi:cytochrome c oxidase cbb3-type subunit 3
LTDADSLEKGRVMFESDTHPCRACHRADLGGLVGPDLTDNQWLHGCTVAAVSHSIRAGFPLQGMPPYGGGPALSDTELLQLTSYVLAKRGSAPPGAKAPDPVRDQVCE